MTTTRMDRADFRRAKLYQRIYPVLMRLLWSSGDLEFATKRIAKPTTLIVPTRHGDVKALVYSPTNDDLGRLAREGRRPPVHLLIHGGAFIIRAPWQDGSIARFIASELNTSVIVPDYDTAPDVRWPVAEDQNDDVYRWILDNGAAYGWDLDRLTIGGASAGSKFAMSVVAQALDDGIRIPLAITSEFGCADLSRPDDTRATPLKNPIVSQEMIGLVRRTYFLDADVADPRVSVSLHPRLAEFPPTLIMTGEHDTLRWELDDLASDLVAKGVDVTHRTFPGVDHGFTHNKPVEIAREAIHLIGDHLRAAHARVDAAQAARRESAPSGED